MSGRFFQKTLRLLSSLCLACGLVRGLSKAFSDVLQGDWPWESWTTVPKEDFVAKGSYSVGAVASQSTDPLTGITVAPGEGGLQFA